MHTTMNARTLAAATLVLSACAGPETPAGKGFEEPLPIDGAADSFYSPTWHGEFDLSARALEHAELTAGSRYHAWDFVVGHEGEVSLETLPDGDGVVDTYLYLYRLESDGFQSWASYLARDDDGGADYFSRLEQTLPPGSYRVLVKGYGDG